MPTYVVEHQGKRYKVEADTPQQATEAFGPDPDEVAAQSLLSKEGPLTDQERAQMAEMEERLAYRPARKAAAAGTARAPRAFAEGAGDLALSAGRGLAGMANRPDLAMQLEGYQKERFKPAVEAARAESEAAVPGSVLVGDVVAGVLPIGGSISRVGKATRASVAAIQAALEGGALANLPYDPSDERVTRTAIGAALPGVTKLVASSPAAFMNIFARKLAKRRDSQTIRVMDEAKAAFINPETGKALPGSNDYTIAQVMGDQRLGRLAGQSVNTRARDVVRQQLDDRVAMVRQVADSLPTGNMSPEKRAEVIHGVIKSAGREIQRGATAEYDTGLKALRATQEGQAIRVPLKAVTDEVTALEKDLGDIQGRLRGTTTGHKLAQTIDELKALSKGNVRELKLDGLEKLQKELNAARTHGGGLPSDSEKLSNLVSTRLRKAVDATIESTPNAPGYAELKAIQQQYAGRMTELRRLRSDQINKLFGKPDVMANPEQAFDMFINLPPSAQAKGVDLLTEHSPETIAYFRKRYLDKVMDEATRAPRPAMTSQLDPEKLFEGLTGDAIKKNPLFSAKEKAWAQSAAKDIRVILNSFPDVTKPGTDLPPADIAINIVSLTPAFMARFAARALTGTKLEDILFTQQGRRSLETVANLRTASGSARDRATAYFLGLINREGEEQVQEE